MVNKVSIIIPARHEEFLQRTIDDLLIKARGEIEIIAILDGYWPNPPLKTDNRVHVIHRSEPRGMRSATNAGAKIARGKYLLKCDAHCIFGEGYDKILERDCEYDWTLVPRRFGLNRKEWKRNDDIYDFQYITSPDDPNYCFKGANWPEYNARVNGQPIVDLMTSQGSCWFMHRDRFFELDGLDEDNYGWMGREAQEICLKSWLSGGRFMLDRNTWYAHLKRGTRPYKKSGDWYNKSKRNLIDVWMQNRWPKQIRKLEWLLEKFKPVPSWHEKESLRANRYIQEKFRLGCVREYPHQIRKFNRRSLCNLWKDLGYKVGCEVGVRSGEFSELMFLIIPDLKMYLVDVYKDYKDRSTRNREHDKYEVEAHKRLDQYNSTFIKKFSADAVKDIRDGSLDFVYIDANHKYKYVMEDVELWAPKVRKGGMVSGHDYFCNNRTRCAVKLAVDDYAEINDVVPWFLTDNRKKYQEFRSDRKMSWFWIKK